MGPSTRCNTLNLDDFTDVDGMKNETGELERFIVSSSDCP